MELQLKEADTT